VYGVTHTTFSSLPGMRDRTIVLGGFSKDYAMTGWRLGFALAPSDILEAMRKVHQYTIMSAPTTAQVAAIAALTDPAAEEAVLAMRDSYNVRRKLLVDGLRDLLLSPLSILAAVIGLVLGGDRPDQYFRRVVRFGLRTEKWINLFGEHGGPGTADHLVDPLRSRVIDEARANPWLSKAGTKLNRQLDGVNSALASQETEGPAPDDPQDPTARRADPTRAPD